MKTNPEQTSADISRRLVLGGVVGVTALAVPGISGIAEAQSVAHTVEKGEQQPIDDLYERGISSDFNMAAMFPGIIAVDPQIAYSKTVSGEARKQEWTPKNQSYVVVERPIFVKPTLEVAQDGAEPTEQRIIKDALKHMPPGLVSFYLPNTNALAFFDADANASGLLAFGKYYLGWATTDKAHTKFSFDIVGLNRITEPTKGLVQPYHHRVHEYEGRDPKAVELLRSKAYDENATSEERNKAFEEMGRLPYAVRKSHTYLAAGRSIAVPDIMALNNMLGAYAIEGNDPVALTADQIKQAKNNQ